MTCQCLSAEEYIKQIQRYLPRGYAWDAKVDPATNLYKLLQAVADEAARVDCRGCDLLDEVDPRTTFELLEDWERVLGLPDHCTEQGTTLQERRNAVLWKLNLLGGQSKQFFIDLMAYFGFQITITEFRPFRAGLSTAGQPLYNEEWIYCWEVNAPLDTFIYFRSGISTAGEPLRTWGNDILECILNQLKPAHTCLHFTYS